MQPYISFNGVSSLDKGLRLIAAEPFIIPSRTRQREYIPGKIGSIASDFEMPAIGYTLRFAASGADKGKVVRKLHNIASWIMTARIMTVWHDPEHYFMGSVEGDTDFSMLTRRNGQLEIEFICDPPCRHKALVTGGFIPSFTLPIPEQISESVKTVEAVGKTTDFSLTVGTINSPIPPALYMRLTGYWSTLNIGGMTITEGSGSTTLYIDCEAQEVYKIVSGVRTPVKYSGDFPALINGGIAVSGTGFSLTARLLVIERG